jgi:hypothetical protein
MKLEPWKYKHIQKGAAKQLGNQDKTRYKCKKIR